MKKISLASLSLIFGIAFLFGQLIHTTSVQAASNVIELKLSSHKPPMAAPLKAFEEWAKKVEELTHGKVKITVYSASSLVSSDDIIPATQRGICDIGDLVIPSERQQYPLTSMVNLPFMNLGDPKTGMRIWRELEEKFPEMKAENSKFKTFNRTTASAGDFHSTKKLVRTPADLKGMKVMAQGHLARVVKLIGASPLAIGVPDWYSSLDRGLIEGIFLHYYGVYETKIYELLPYHTDIGSGFALHPEELIMSWDTWNKLPPDVQKVFDDLSPWATERIWELINASIARGIDAMKKAGHTFVKTTPEEEQEWYEVSLPVHNEWIEELEGKGLPARAVYEEALRLGEKYKN